MSIYIGLDSSTQSLTAVVIEVAKTKRRVVCVHSLRFDDEFPSYGTKNGELPGDDPLVSRSSPQMWAEALDRMMGLLAAEKSFSLKDVRAVSGSGQQHGSVYLNAAATATLAALDPKTPLVDQIQGIFSRRNSPIWMDASTLEQCEAITRDIGGEGVLATLTGSRAFERFTGPQIRKFAEEDPDSYEKTDRIHLVSSYMASLVSGKHAPIDPGDGSGTNLMDLARRHWAPPALQVTAPDLAAKLPAIEESWTVVGPVASYWTERHGLPETARSVIWSGDNPCSLIGVGLVKPGRIAISLGTSDTLFGFMPKPRIDPTGVSHAFGSPTGDYMCLICFQNGSLARNAIREEYGLDWADFSKALQETPPGCKGGVLLPWFEPEITPKVAEPGVRRFGLDAKDAALNVRAVVEAQMLSMSLHSQWIGVATETIHATGGAARNREILQVMADVLGAEVYQFSVGNSAALGAALRAYHADRVAEGEKPSWEEIVAGFTEPIKESRIAPNPDLRPLYDDLKRIYAACETHVLKGGEAPDRAIQTFRECYVTP